MLSRYLPSLSNLAAYRCVRAACELLYDFDGFPLNESRYEELRETMERAYGQEDWYVQALQEKANIDGVLWAPREDCSPPETEKELLLPVVNLDAFLFAFRSGERQHLEEKHHARCEELRDLTDVLSEAMSEAHEQGAPAFWLSLCKFRRLMVGNTAYDDAAAIFQKPESAISPEEAVLFQDFIIHFIADQCASANIPLQIDTGTHGTVMSVEQSDPCLLTGLVSAHLRTRFVLLHGAYPFARHLGAQAKTFPNVYLDAGSLAMHSLSVMKAMLGEWVELVPVAKILLWGGNSERIESSVGSLILTRQVLTEILAERVSTGFFTEQLAFDLAQKLLRDIPRRFYKIDEMRVRRQTAAEMGI
jgi:hypothetical protein